MTKEQLAYGVAQRTGVNHAIVRDIIEETYKHIMVTVAAGEQVTLRGFGTFKGKHRAAKPCRNITKGETIVMPEHDVPAFKPCNLFKDMMKK